GRALGALVGDNNLVDRLAQPALVEVTGQLIVIGQPFEARLLRLAVANRADDAEHDLRPPGIVAPRLAALVHPEKIPRGVAQAILAVERGVIVKMAGQGEPTLDKVVGRE